MFSAHPGPQGSSTRELCRSACRCHPLAEALGGVQRAARRARESPVSRVAVADPIVELLTPADMEHLGVSAADAGGELSMLDKYRILGLPPSEAGHAARQLFDHGRGADAFHQRLH